MYIFMSLTERVTVGLGRYFQPLGSLSNLLSLSKAWQDYFHYQLNTCMAMAARESGFHNESILFFQMQVINANTVLTLFTERYIFIKLLEEKLVAQFQEVLQLCLRVKLYFILLVNYQKLLLSSLPLLKNKTCIQVRCTW